VGNSQEKEIVVVAKKALSQPIEIEGQTFAFNSESGKWEAKEQPEEQPTEQPTANQWLDSAPPEIRQVVVNAMEHDKQERTKLVKQLVDNVSTEEEKKSLGEYLSTKSLPELKTLSLLNNKQAEEPQRKPVYFGASGGLSTNQSSEAEDIGLPLPKIDWSQTS